MSQERKIKVGLMSYAFDNRVAKGSAVYARNLVENLLDDSRFEFTLIHYEHVDDPIYRRAGEIVMPQLPVRSRWLQQLCFFWKFRKQKFDIIHWFQPRLYPGYWWAPARLRVCTIHGGGKYYYPFFSMSARMFHWVLRFASRWIDSAIVCTNFSRQEAIDTYKLKPEQVAMTYNGGGENFQALDRAGAFSKISAKYPSIQQPFVLTVSRLQPHKNIATLVRAYIAMRDLGQRNEQLVVVAKPTDQYAEVYDLARSSAYSSDIIFIDFVEPELLNAMYSAATLFVFPSFSEGFGIPVVEAMASGTPVIVSNASCLPEVAGAAGITFDPTKPTELAAAMERVLANPELQNSMAAAGREQASQFTWARTAEATKKIYLDLYAS
jgi:glycosyltransferase involved in cell wall biosynthesis